MSCGGAPDGPREQRRDLRLEHLIGRQTDRVLEALRLQVLVHIRQGEGRIAAQQAPERLATIARDHRVEHVVPAVRAVDVPRSQRTPFQVTVLVEHEEGMVAGAGEVPVVCGAFLRAVRRAHAAVDIEHQRRPGTSSLRAVDPAPREISQRRQVRRRGHRARLEAAHLAGGRGLLRHRAAAHDPSHRRIAPEAVGIVHVLVAGEAPEHRLTQLSDQAVAPVPPGAGVGEHLGCQRRQAERVVEFPEREQPGIRGDGDAVEFELQATVEIEPETSLSLSPVASSIRRPLRDRQTLAVHSRFGQQRHQPARSSGKCGFRPRGSAKSTRARWSIGLISNELGRPVGRARRGVN
jgi:hypothetical protein